MKRERAEKQPQELWERRLEVGCCLYSRQTVAGVIQAGEQGRMFAHRRTATCMGRHHIFPYLSGRYFYSAFSHRLHFRIHFIPLDHSPERN